MRTRHSSRRSRLDQTVLNQRLDGAVGYDRIAGWVAPGGTLLVVGHLHTHGAPDDGHGHGHQPPAEASATAVAMRNWTSRSL